ncbi:MAG: tRNA lysidine(34) synthetase TilS [Verrucomicrobiota bacterium]
MATASPRRRWLVGVSGGADSVALLHLLVRAGWRHLVVCHLDHRLRGRASTEDGRFVQKLAATLDLPVEIQRLDVAQLARDRGESLETAARWARHEFFAACAKQHRCHRVILAHHADDQAETLLWNLLRGSHGLKGMHTEQRIVTEAGVALQISRPLLGLRRAELRAWLTANRLRWREDASNGEAVATRNRLRHEALPLLSEIAGRDAAAMLLRAAVADAEAGEILAWAVEQAQTVDPQGRLHLPALRKLPPPLQRAAMLRYLKNHGVGEVSRALLERGMRLLDPAAPPALNLPGGARLRRREARAFIEFGKF